MEGAPPVHARRAMRSLHPFAVVVASMALAPVASAATVTVSGSDGGQLRFAASEGESNDVVLDAIDDARMQITDRGAVITATGKCRSIDVHTAECRGAGKDPIFYEAKLELGDLDDRVAPIRKREDIEVTAHGGPGNDVLMGAVNHEEGAILSGGQGDDQLYGTRTFDDLKGGDGQDQLFGGDGGGDQLDGGFGDDRIFAGEFNFNGAHLDGGGGQDQLYGGPGDDTLADGDGDGAAAAPGPDTMVGGEGVDLISYESRTQAVTVRAGDAVDNGEAGEHDSTTGIENLSGGAGDDLLIGDKHANVLTGGEGEDRPDCGGGRDLLESPDPGVVVPRSCEELRFWWDCNRYGCLRFLFVEAQPITGRNDRLKLRTMCPYIYDSSNIGCRGTTSLHEAGASHRLLGRDHFREAAGGAFTFSAPVALTRTGTEWWETGLPTDTATVSLHVIARATPRRPFRWNITPPVHG